MRAVRYLNHLLPLLRTTLVDPIPDVRATAAKAFGTLCKGLPEGAVENLVPELVDLLCRRATLAVNGVCHYGNGCPRRKV